ncbi:MAG: replication initiation protein [Treponema sp.]|nr:replication initiation protein [Treponema sp.]
MFKQAWRQASVVKPASAFTVPRKNYRLLSPRRAFGGRFLCTGENVVNFVAVFRRKVIEVPVREINEAGIGVEIKSESIKKGRNVVGFRFECKSASRTAGKKRWGGGGGSIELHSG